MKEIETRIKTTIIASLFIFALASVSTVHATSITVYQDNTPEELDFLKIVGEFRAAGIYVSYTFGQGLTYLSDIVIVEAYGEEEIIDIVVLPFKFNDKDCIETITTYSNQTKIIDYTCQWNDRIIPGDNKTSTDPAGEEDPEDKSWIDELFEPDTTDKDVEPTPEEKRLADLKEDALDAPLTGGEEKALMVLDKINEICELDVAQIQTYKEFDVPTQVYRDPVTGEMKVQLFKDYGLKAVNLKNFPFLKQALLKVEECLAERILKSDHVTGPETFNKHVDNEYSERVSHPDLAKYLFKYPQVNLVPEDYDRTKAVAQEKLCSNNLYGQDLKLQQKCSEATFVDVGGKIETFNQPYHSWQEWKNRDQGINSSVNTKIAEGTGVGPIGKFIIQQGGYDKAIDAIKFKQHVDTLDPVKAELDYKEQ